MDVKTTLLNEDLKSYCNPLSTPMEQNLKLTSKEENDLRMQLNIDNLWGVLSNLLLPDRTFHLQLCSFLGSCKNLVKDISVLQRGF
jgi:hypothetical protein